MTYSHGILICISLHGMINAGSNTKCIHHQHTNILTYQHTNIQNYFRVDEERWIFLPLHSGLKFHRLICPQILTNYKWSLQNKTNPPMVTFWSKCKFTIVENPCKLALAQVHRSHHHYCCHCQWSRFHLCHLCQAPLHHYPRLPPWS